MVAGYRRSERCPVVRTNVKDGRGMFEIAMKRKKKNYRASRNDVAVRVFGGSEKEKFELAGFYRCKFEIILNLVMA